MLPPYTAGGSQCGTEEPLAGRIRNLEAFDPGFTSSELQFALEETNGGAVAVFADGLFYAYLPEGKLRFAVAGLKPGTHSVSLEPLPPDSPAERIRLEALGQRARFTWIRSADATCAAYNVLWNTGGTGEPTTLLANVNALAIEERVQVIADTGDGGLGGRISSFGAVPPGQSAINVVVDIEVTASGAYSYSVSGDVLGTGTFNAGDTVSLAYGLRVTFHDDPEDYTTGADWSVAIGPSNEFLSDALPPANTSLRCRRWTSRATKATLPRKSGT
jgi:hypothetical protein